MSACVFCKIVARQQPARWVFEDDHFAVFLDHSPLFYGHCLVLPKAHRADLLDLPAGDVGPLFELVQRVARALESGLGADGSFVAVNTKVSQSVPHLHVHVVPRKKGDGLFARGGLIWKRRPYGSEAEAQGWADRVAAALTASP